MKLPTYREALERHETPLDCFISRWQPVDSKSYAKNFREDLTAVLLPHVSLYHAVLDTVPNEWLDLIADKLNAVAAVLGEPPYSDTHGKEKE